MAEQRFTFSSGYFETACGGKKKNVHFFLFCCKNELNSDVPSLTTHQLNLPKVENRSTFCKKISTLRAFYRPRANLFCSYSDVTRVYGVTPVQFYPIRSQCSHNLHQLNFLQESFELGWKSAQHNISTSFAVKQVARFCCLFYPSLKSQSNFKTKRTKKTYFYSPILLILKKKNNITLTRSI